MTESIFSLPSAKRRSLLDTAAAQYNESVELVLPYLTKRGVDDVTAMDWCLGYVLDPLPGHERFKGYLSIPYITPSGVVGMKFRCTQDHKCEGHPKYDSEPGGGTYLFGVSNVASDSRSICVTEGELDAIVATQCGLPAVGISGATKWKRHWRYVFDGFDDIIVLQDGDTAGEKLTRNVLGSVDKARAGVMPQGDDVSSFVASHGAQALRERCGVDASYLPLAG